MQRGEEKLLIAAVVPALVADVLERFGAARLRVSGTSMRPAILPGDVLTVHRCAIADVRSGDVILFTAGERLFVHRVTRTYVESGIAFAVTKGDALGSHDPPVPASNLLGRVTAIGRRAPTMRERARGSSIGRACGMATTAWRGALHRLHHRLFARA